MARWLLWIAMVCGCADEVAIAPGVCGNWVLEPGEDCDRPGGACTETCRIRCDPAIGARCVTSVDGTCCPDGFACGVDQTCHAPAGAFGGVELIVPVEASAFRVADLDGDRLADVLAVGGDAVTAVYGATHAPFARIATRSAPSATGAPAIGDYTGDGRPDVVWPVAGGLAAVTTRTGLVEPVAFPARVTPGVDQLRVGVVQGTDVIRIDTSNAGKLAIVDDRTHDPRAICGYGLDPTMLRGRGIHPFDDGGLGQHVLVPIPLGPTAPTTPPLLCVDGGAQGRFVFARAPVGAEDTTAGEAFFATVDPAAPCPDLVEPVAFAGLPGLATFPGVGAPGSCTIDTTARTLAVVGAPLAPLVLAGGGPGLVTSDGILDADLTSCFLCVKLAAPRQWTYAVVADLDGDGRDDVAVASAGADVDVYFQDLDGWVARRILTDGVVAQLAAGDFDGDGALDLAILIADPSDPSATRLQFAFGAGRAFTQAGPPLAVPDLHGLATAQLVDPALPAIGLLRPDGLALVSGDAARGAVTIVDGSPDRVPRAVWRYAGTFGDVVEHAGEALLALIGPFGPDRGPGLLGAFAPAPGETTVQGGAVELGLVAPTAGTLATMASESLVPCSAGNFCPLTASYATLVEPDGAVVLGFADGDDHADCGGFFQLAPQSIPAFSVLDCSGLPDVAAMRDVHLARVLDGEGTDATLLALGTGWSASPSLATVRVGFAAGVPAFTDVLDLSAELSLAIGAPARCIDAVAIELGTRQVDEATYGKGRELVVACRAATVAGPRTTVFAVFASPVATAAPLVETLFALDGDQPIALAAGDIDGDGLDDLVYTTRVAGVATLRARLQCDSHGSCGAP